MDFDPAYQAYGRHPAPAQEARLAGLLSRAEQVVPQVLELEALDARAVRGGLHYGPWAATDVPQARQVVEAESELLDVVQARASEFVEVPGRREFRDAPVAQDGPRPGLSEAKTVP
jgi:hypothetical protein